MRQMQQRNRTVEYMTRQVAYLRNMLRNFIENELCPGEMCRLLKETNCPRAKCGLSKPKCKRVCNNCGPKTVFCEIMDKLNCIISNIDGLKTCATTCGTTCEDICGCEQPKPCGACAPCSSCCMNSKRSGCYKCTGCGAKNTSYNCKCMKKPCDCNTKVAKLRMGENYVSESGNFTCECYEEVLDDKQDNCDCDLENCPSNFVIEIDYTSYTPDNPDNPDNADNPDNP